MKLQPKNKQPKAMENPDSVVIKPAIIERPKTSHQLFKVVRKTEELSDVIWVEKLILWNKKNENLLNNKIWK